MAIGFGIAAQKHIYEEIVIGQFQIEIAIIYKGNGKQIAEDIIGRQVVGGKLEYKIKTFNHETINWHHRRTFT